MSVQRKPSVNKTKTLTAPLSPPLTVENLPPILAQHATAVHGHRMCPCLKASSVRVGQLSRSPQRSPFSLTADQTSLASSTRSASKSSRKKPFWRRPQRSFAASGFRPPEPTTRCCQTESLFTVVTSGNDQVGSRGGPTPQDSEYLQIANKTNDD